MLFQMGGVIALVIRAARVTAARDQALDDNRLLNPISYDGSLTGTNLEQRRPGSNWFASRPWNRKADKGKNISSDFVLMNATGRQAMQSNPSNARTAAALVLYSIAGLAALAWKIFRGGLAGDDGPVPLWIAGALPNFIPAGFLPMLLFITGRELRAADFACLVGAVLLALSVYEFAQIAMPGRTFDWVDIAASAAGSIFGFLIGWLVFFRWLGSSVPEADSDKSES